MEQLFVQYSTKMRCMNYLERLVNEAERAEMQRQQLVATKRNTEAISFDREEPDQTEMLSFEDNSPEQKPIIFTRPERPRASTGGKKMDTNVYVSLIFFFLYRTPEARTTIKIFRKTRRSQWIFFRFKQRFRVR